mmetsp:Transcript_35222/g.94370  ORF Transcript_35222/g.94370 Transcript_35222/m.94370 type:complete len:214 (+) Transcript_35222:635-1276(+)
MDAAPVDRGWAELADAGPEEGAPAEVRHAADVEDDVLSCATSHHRQDSPEAGRVRHDQLRAERRLWQRRHARHAGHARPILAVAAPRRVVQRRRRLGQARRQPGVLGLLHLRALALSPLARVAPAALGAGPRQTPLQGARQQHEEPERQGRQQRQQRAEHGGGRRPPSAAGSPGAARAVGARGHGAELSNARRQPWVWAISDAVLDQASKMTQ